MAATRKAWNAVDDARLVRLWNEGEMGLGEIAVAVGHTCLTTHKRARRLGLGIPAPEGWELLTRAARRAGVEVPTLRRILQQYGATIRRALTKPCRSVAPHGSKYIRLRYIVHQREVDAAVEHWVGSETVAEAARRLGMSRTALKSRLMRAGVRQLRAVGRPVAGARPEWRVTQDDVDAALAVRVVPGRPRIVEEAPRHDQREAA